MKKTMIAMAAAAMGLASEAQTQTNANLEYIKSAEQDIIKPNLFYELPGEIDGYTFGQFYNTGGENKFYSKSTLKKEATEKVALRSETKVGSDIDTIHSFGAQVDATLGDAYIQTKWLPISIQNGNKTDSNLIGYFVSKPLKLPIVGDTKFSSFGEWDLTKKNWTYGEVNLERELNENLSLQYNAALRNDGDMTPDLEHRIALKINL